MVMRAHHSALAGVLEEKGEGRVLVASNKEMDGVRFRAVLARYQRVPEGYLISPEAYEGLGIEDGERLGIMPLIGDGIKDFYRVDKDLGEWQKL